MIFSESGESPQITLLKMYLSLSFTYGYSHEEIQAMPVDVALRLLQHADHHLRLYGPSARWQRYLSGEYTL